MPDPTPPVRFTLVPDRSALLVTVSSSVGPITFGGMGLEGFLEVAVTDGDLDLSVAPSAHVELPVSRLTSGNTLYDAELLRQINARGFPTAFADLHGVATAAGGRFRVKGELTFHGITRTAEGTVSVERPRSDAIVVEGEQTFDLRDFALPPPGPFMIKIRPDIEVRLHLEAEAQP
jgi:polyisoprenoid-binding protein YceI